MLENTSEFIQFGVISEFYFEEKPFAFGIGIKILLSAPTSTLDGHSLAQALQ
jgi:hypothetical protein